MKLIMLMISFAFASESVQFTPATTKLDIKSATTVIHKDAEITALEGWSIGMNAYSNNLIAFEILLTPTKDLNTSDVHTGLLLKGVPPKMTLNAKQKMYSNKGYQVKYQMINGENWLFSQREITHKKGFPYIEITGDLIKGNKEYLILAGYPKNQEVTFKSQIDKIAASTKIKN